MKTKRGLKILPWLFPFLLSFPLLAQQNNKGYIFRSEGDKDNFSTNIKLQNLHRRATTQFYWGLNYNNTNKRSLKSSTVVFNPLIRKKNFDGAVAFIANFNDDPERNSYAIEIGADVFGSNTIYLGQAKLPDANVTSVKVGRKFGRSLQLEGGVTHTNKDSGKDQNLYHGVIRTTLGDIAEINAKADFNNLSDLEKITIVAQLNSVGNRKLPGARYFAIIADDPKKPDLHSLLLGFGKNKKFSYYSVAGAVDAIYTPHALENPACLHYGNGTLSHGYADNVVKATFLDLPGNEQDKLSLEFYKNFHNIAGIDNPHISLGYEKSGKDKSYSAGVGIQKGNFFGKVNAKISDGKIKGLNFRTDYFFGIPKDKQLLEL